MTVRLPIPNVRGMKASALLSDDDPVNYRPGCDHGSDAYELRILTTANGVKQFKFECQVCGRRGSAVSKTHAIVANLKAEPAPVDDGIGRRYWDQVSAERRAAFEQERADQRAEWWRRYELYLESDKWKRKRKRVLIRDRFQCQAAMDGCLNDATEVHHLTYQHLFNEPLFELIAVCSRCHEKITALDREKRAA